MHQQIIDAAHQYLQAGLAALPARKAEKCPTVTWKRYQQQRPTAAEAEQWFTLDSTADAVCVVCGTSSRHVEMIDFDAAGEAFEPWLSAIPDALRNRLVIERTPSGGFHIVYRCAEPVGGNMKIAQRFAATPSNEPVVMFGKTIKPIRHGDGWGVVVTLIETRGEGGLFLCAPTPGYEMMFGSLDDLPILTEAERETLLQAAWNLNQYWPPVLGPAEPKRGAVPIDVGGVRPGDAYNRLGDVRGLLVRHGWTRVREQGDNEQWRRPGKERGISATLRLIDGVLLFYVFSSSAPPFEPGRAYAPFAVCALLDHGGDFRRAAVELAGQGFGAAPEDDGFDPLEMLVQGRKVGAPREVAVVAAIEPTEYTPPPTPPTDPGLAPVELLRVPGFVSQVVDFSLATAPYPNPAMAFAGALALLALLTGRKVRDSGDNRTNIYLLGLAHSAAGKDWPRKINTRILHQVGLADALGERFASGEGIQDALHQTPAMLFQTDEMDGMIQAINKSRDARHEAIMSTLLTMYSSANSVFPVRRRANALAGHNGRKKHDDDAVQVIDQPHLVLFGTAIPTHYYEALSERMLTNGFFARTIVLEAGPRGVGQEPGIVDVPPQAVSTARWWADYRPSAGNLSDECPQPATVPHTDEARRRIIEVRREAEHEYGQAEGRGDAVATTVWGRVSEQVRKLALLYACSENHEQPRISREAVNWASALTLHQVRRMLYMAATHVADSPFHAECLRVADRLRAAPGWVMAHQDLLKKTKLDAKSFAALMDTLIQQGDVEIVMEKTDGRPYRGYRLARDVS